MAKLVLNTTTDLLRVEVGARIKLHDERQGVVEENMGDGQWLSVLFDGDDESELVHSQDIAGVHSAE